MVIKGKHFEPLKDPHFFIQKASLTRKCHNHKLKTYPQHYEEEIQNTDTYNSPSSLFLSKMIAKNHTTKQGVPTQKPHTQCKQNYE